MTREKETDLKALTADPVLSALRQELSRLPGSYRLILLLRVYDALPAGEIAQLLQWDVSAVEQACRCALDLLKESIADIGFSPPDDMESAVEQAFAQEIEEQTPPRAV